MSQYTYSSLMSAPFICFPPCVHRCSAHISGSSADAPSPRLEHGGAQHDGSIAFPPLHYLFSAGLDPNLTGLNGINVTKLNIHWFDFVELYCIRCIRVVGGLLGGLDQNISKGFWLKSK